MPQVNGEKYCMFVALPVSHEAPPYCKAEFSQVMYTVVENKNIQYLISNNGLWKKKNSFNIALLDMYISQCREHPVFTLGSELWNIAPLGSVLWNTSLP